MEPGREERQENRAGVYATIAFHLGALVVLLLAGIGAVAEGEHTFVLDFTRQEALERRMEEERREAEIKAEAVRQIEDLFGREPVEIRNVRVDASESRRERLERENLMKEAEALQERLDASRRHALKEEQAAADRIDTDTSTESKEESRSATGYSGPSVLTYKLDGRKARSLPVPAYKGFGGGDVYVAIRVNRAGRVVGAGVIEGVSTADGQLRQYALEAALRSRFSPSETAPDPQGGEIVYRFIAQ